MKIFIGLIFFFVYQHTAAQAFDNIISFTTQNGLSNNSITCLEKDEDGFLWVGTQEGLNQYDGTEFISVLRNAKNNLPSNIINKICCINKTTLAVSTRGGLCFLNTKIREGKKIGPPDSKIPGQNTYLAWDILYDKKKKELWVGTADGLYVLSDEGKLKRKIEADKADATTGVFALYLFQDKFDNIFFFSQKRYGFFYADFDKGGLLPVESKLPDFPLNKLTSSKYVLRGASFIDNKIICCFTKTAEANKKNILAFYDNVKSRGVIDSLSINFTNTFFLFNSFPLSDSVLLMNSYFGEPYLYNLNTLQIKPAASHSLWFTSWPDGIDAKLLVDKKNIWVATSKGLLQIPQYTDIFKSNALLVNYINANTSLVSYNYGTYHEGKLWLSCLGRGVFSLDTSRNKIQDVFGKNTEAKFQRKIISKELMKAGSSLWLFSIYGPAQINTANLKLSYIQAQNKDSLFDDIAGFPFKDSKGNIWTSLTNGISKYSALTNSFIAYKNKQHGGEFPLEKSFFKTEDINGNIWFARQDTLVKFDATAETFSIFLLKKDGLAIRPVQELASGGKDILYMYLDGAFAIYHISTGAIDLFTKETGIVSTSINQIVTDKKGNPWIATGGGLVYYNNQSKQFYSYTKADGLPDDNVISINFADDAKNILYLGFSKSYCVFNPEGLLQKRNTAVQNTITGVEVNGQVIAFDEKRTFSYKNNNISFFYTGINFIAGQQNSYAYMLQGFDKDWKYSGKKRQCSYINLPPGNYTFKIKSANQQGEWNETPASFSFTISSPFWQTWWFRMPIAILTVILIYWFIKRRENIKEKENSAALKMSELKLTALQSQMNPHFIFNSLNSIQNYIMQQKPVDAARYLSKFSKLMRRVLDQSFNNLIPLNEIADTLNMYLELEAFRFSNGFEYEIKVDEPESIIDVKLPPLLIQPYVENAIIHGLMPKEGSKKLLIYFYIQNNELHCVIDDNGIGRGSQLAEKGQNISRGQNLTIDMLATMKQLLNKEATISIIDKKDTSNNAEGTTVELIIPL